MPPAPRGIPPFDRFRRRRFFRRFFDGFWWDWWPGYGWIVVTGQACGQWSDPIVHPDAALSAEAENRLRESDGQPVSEVFDGVMYLFERTSGGTGLVIRRCVVPTTTTSTIYPTGVYGVGQVAFQAVTDNKVQAGLRYTVDFLVTSIGSGDPRIYDYANSMTDTDKTSYLQGLLSADWMVESLTKTTSVTGGVESWEMVGIARHSMTLTNDAFFSWTRLAVQASAAPGPMPPAKVQPPGPATAPSAGVSAGTIALGALGVAAVGGIAWGLTRRRRRRR